MSEKVMFVDDDQKVLNAISRQFEDILDFETANGPEAALERLSDKTPFAVVVCDMQMPGMNGVELLSRVKEQSPDTVRVMLTGYADFQVSVKAINEGNIFCFLSKPCPPNILEKAVRDGLAQYRLVTAERELLEGTLHGSIKVLSEILSLVCPAAFGRTSQVQRIALAIAEDLQISNAWDLKIATMLFPLGYVSVSESVLEYALAGRPIPDRDQAVFSQHASIARNLLEKIPRLETVATIVGYQDKHFDGSGNPKGSASGDEIPLGARILKVASDFEIAYRQSDDAAAAFRDLSNRSRQYDPQLLISLKQVLRNGLCQSSRREVSIDQLAVGMVLASEVRTADWRLMVNSGQEVTESIRRRLRDLCDKKAVDSTFVVQSLKQMQSTELAPL